MISNKQKRELPWRYTSVMSLLPAEQHWCQQWRIRLFACYWRPILVTDVYAFDPQRSVGFRHPWNKNSAFCIACGMFNILWGVTLWRWVLNLKQHCIIHQDCITMSWLDISSVQDNAQPEDGFSTAIAKVLAGKNPAWLFSMNYCHLSADMSLFWSVTKMELQFFPPVSRHHYTNSIWRKKVIVRTLSCPGCSSG